MSNVVSLGERAAKEDAEIDAELVAALEVLLVRAKAGEMTGLAWIATIEGKKTAVDFVFKDYAIGDLIAYSRVLEAEMTEFLRYGGPPPWAGIVG